MRQRRVGVLVEPPVLGDLGVLEFVLRRPVAGLGPLELEEPAAALHVDGRRPDGRPLREPEGVSRSEEADPLPVVALTAPAKDGQRRRRQSVGREVLPAEGRPELDLGQRVRLLRQHPLLHRRLKPRFQPPPGQHPVRRPAVDLLEDGEAVLQIGQGRPHELPRPALHARPGRLDEGRDLQLGVVGVVRRQDLDGRAQQRRLDGSQQRRHRRILRPHLVPDAGRRRPAAGEAREELEVALDPEDLPRADVCPGGASPSRARSAHRFSPRLVQDDPHCPLSVGPVKRLTQLAGLRRSDRRRGYWVRPPLLACARPRPPTPQRLRAHVEPADTRRCPPR